MKSVKVYRVRNGARNVVFEGRVATSMIERLRGLLGRRPLVENQALVISSCSSIHTFGMGYDIDVAFLDRHGRVIKCVERVRPRRFAGAWLGKSVIETAAGALRCADVRKGDQVYWCTRIDSEKNRGTGG